MPAADILGGFGDWWIRDADRCCDSCRGVWLGQRAPLWPNCWLIEVRFFREMELYSLRHPFADLAEASVWVCGEIDRAMSGGRPSDLCLVVQGLAELTGARMSPANDGWRLRKADRAVRVCFECQISVQHLTVCGIWRAEEQNFDLGEPTIIEWLSGWLMQTITPTPPSPDRIEARFLCMNGENDYLRVGEDDYLLPDEFEEDVPSLMSRIRTW